MRQCETLAGPPRRGRARGCHDLTLGKIYECLGLEGRGSFLRIVDDSGDDFLYPLSHFKEV